MVMTYRSSVDNDPHVLAARILDAKPLTDEPTAIRTANILNEITYAVNRLLKDHPQSKTHSRRNPPANAILFAVLDNSKVPTLKTSIKSKADLSPVLR